MPRQLTIHTIFRNLRKCKTLNHILRKFTNIAKSNLLLIGIMKTSLHTENVLQLGLKFKHAYSALLRHTNIRTHSGAPHLHKCTHINTPRLHTNT